MQAFCDTPERRSEIKEYWDNVRAGLHQPEEHDWGPHTEGTIAAHKYLAGKLIEQAAKHAQKAIDLAKSEESHDYNMQCAIDEFDLLNVCDANALICIAEKHNVDADDLFEAWANE